MPSRYDDRDYDRGERNYGRGWNSESGRSGEERSRMRPRFDRDEGERYSTEDRWRGDFNSSSQSRPWREGEYGRNRPGSGIDWQGETDSSEDRSQSRYGRTGRGYDTGHQYAEGYGEGRQYREGRNYGEGASMRPQRYNYPSGSRSRETYGGHGAYEDYGARYLREEGRDYDYDRGSDYGREERGWWDRASDEVASWFGDEDATRRRRRDQQREEYRGRGPKNYRRSDERIKDDINDRLSEGYLDASNIEVEVQSTEVVLTGTVNSRADKRRAEAIAESVTGVSNVENRLRVKQSEYGRYSGTELSGTTSTTGTTGTTDATGTTGTSASGTSAKRAGTGS